jgi:hypothetical protein
MSASHICPQCNNSTFRSPDNDSSYVICECVDLDGDANELAEQNVFRILHDALVAAGYDRALDGPGFCAGLLAVAKAAVKLTA